MSFKTQLMVCCVAFGLTTVLVDSSASDDGPFETVQDFQQFKKERRLMWCEMVPQLSDDEKWIRDVPSCSFGGYYPDGPTTQL